MLTPYGYQIEMAEDGHKILAKENIVYLAHEERVGKSIPSILICDMVGAKTVLIVTKRKAYDDWSKLLQDLPHKCICELTTYHSIHKVVNKDPDVIILDESHNNISGYPKPGPIWYNVKDLTYKKKIIYISATPYAEGVQLLYHQFKLSYWSPWKQYKNFYLWFRIFGVSKKAKVKGLLIETYKNSSEQLALSHVKHLFLRKTRIETGFAVEPENKKHYIKLSKNTKKFYNHLLDKHTAKLRVGDNVYILVADTAIQLLHYLYMLEGGTTKITKKLFTDDKVKKYVKFISLKCNEKISYIKDNFGDTSSLVIMYNYIAEGKKLKHFFKRAEILQATANSEGIDLSGYDDLVIYSQDFSTARYSQRRARQANRNRKKPIVVHYLLVKDAISDQVYSAVVDKHKNFTANIYNNTVLT